MAPTGFLDPVFVSYYEQNENGRTTDIPFYLGKAQEANGPVLEAGCGSGRILLPLLQSGLDAEGFDYSQIMLEELSRNLSARSLNARAWAARLEDVILDQGKYSLIISGFNTFVHLLDQDSQLGALRRLHDALRIGGTIILDIINPANFDVFSRQALKRTFEATIYDMASEAEIAIWRWFERDLITQRGVYHREYVTSGRSGTATKATEVEFRWTYPEEMKLLLQLAGFSNAKVFGDFNDAPLDEESEMQVWVAQKT